MKKLIVHSGFLSTVVWQDWSVRVTASRAEAGGPALLTCTVPAARKEHASVAAWYRDDTVLVPTVDDLSKCFINFKTS